MRKFLLAAILVVLPILNILNIAHASDNAPGVGQALSISPSILELKADPGQSIKTSIKIRNDITTDLLVKNTSQDFTAQDDPNQQGVPKLIPNETEPGPRTIHNYIETVPDFLLKGHETKEIPITINVPKDAQPGAHYGTILFTGEPAPGQNLTIHATLGNLVFLNVSGATKDDLKLLDFFSSDTNFNKQWFFEWGPIYLNEWVKNEGNTVVSPSGRVEIKDIFGRKVADIPMNEITNNKEKTRFVLPGTTRKYYQKWDKTWLLGPYSAHLIMNYGSAGNGRTFADQTITFWVIPWKLILLIIVLTILIVWLTRRGIKKYNKAIVNKDRRRTGR